jgi:MoxR-like ATPase
MGPCPEASAAGHILGRIRRAVGEVVVGKEEAVDNLLVAVLCQGHVLLEDVPGFLVEAMEERQVTVDGRTTPLRDPFPEGDDAAVRADAVRAALMDHAHRNQLRRGD